MQLFVDEFEMEEIRNNSELNKSLKRSLSNVFILIEYFNLKKVASK